MASLKDMRTRIASVKATRKITKAMQMVAAAKLRRRQHQPEVGVGLAQANDEQHRQLAALKRELISEQLARQRLAPTSARHRSQHPTKRHSGAASEHLAAQAQQQVDADDERLASIDTLGTMLFGAPGGAGQALLGLGGQAGGREQAVPDGRLDREPGFAHGRGVREVGQPLGGRRGDGVQPVGADREGGRS